MDWRHRAICRDEDPELFFPVGNSGPALRQIAEAKTVCRRCPVTSECLEWALESGQDAGVWGGMSEDERRALKRRMARPIAVRAVTRTQPAECEELTVAQVQAAAGELLDVSMEVLLSPRGTRRAAVWPRWAAMYVSYDLTRKDVRDIAAAFKRTPRSFVTSLTGAVNLIATQPKFKDMVDRLTDVLMGAHRAEGDQRTA